VKLEGQTKSTSHLEWEPGAIIYRATLATIAALFIICAVGLLETNKTQLAILVLLFASLAIVGLLSWRSIYRSLSFEVSWMARALASSFRVWRLNQRANSIRTRQTSKLLLELERRRAHLVHLLRGSPELRELVNDLSVLVFRGQENPLATLIFSDSLKAMGFHVQHLESFENLPPMEMNKVVGHLIQTSLPRRVMILGRGVDEQTSRVVSYLTSTEWVTVRFYSVSREGLSLFGEEQLHDIPTELYLSLKEYIERAASLGRGPGDTEFEPQSSEVPRVYR
jgi:hypothetical protein